MRRVADAMVTAGSDDGLPRLSGHPERGTAVLPAPVLDDHSADDVHLGSTDGGRVEHTWAEQSVATSDHDRDDKIARSVMFVGEVAT